MRWTLVVMALLVALCSHTEAKKTRGDIWAVLVAGSNTWFNYRHQADVCHAYQILHEHGVPDDHIIVMMYDDLAHNKMNPTPGVVINRPDGPNVYEGVPKDYVGRDVTPENFLKILKGDAEGMQGIGSGKVLKSGHNDHVFINLVDHGAPGIFGFPTTFLHARNFSEGIVSMHRNKQFKEMVIYLEACESGSMFQNLLPDDIGVYALSAANATQSSYACYMDTKLRTFLGDVFSIKWMEDTDREEILHETLEKQFQIVQKATTTSHVLQWGEISISKQKVGSFLGSKKGNASDYGPFDQISDPCLTTSAKTDDADMVLLEMLIDTAETEDEKAFWVGESVKHLTENSQVNQTMKKIVDELTGNATLSHHFLTDTHHLITRWRCYEPSVQTFNDVCYDIAQDTYAMMKLYVFVNLCEHGYSYQEIASAMHKFCI